MILISKTKNKKRTNQNKKNLKLENSDLKFAYIAASAAEDKKGENITLLDVSKLTVISDFFLIITAHSIAQIQAIATHIEEKLSNANYKLLSKEGFVNSNWMVMDFGNLTVHIMNEKERNYYKLEKFWSNATFIKK